MPEIPVMERYRKQLDQLVTGERIRSLHVQRESWLNTDLHSLTNGLVGRQILFIERRGTDLIWHLDDGRRLVLQIGAGSRLEIVSTLQAVAHGVVGHSSAEADQVHDVSHSQFAVITDHAAMAIFGARNCHIMWLTAKQVEDMQLELGPDPLSRHLTPERFSQRFAKRRTTLKSALTNPNIIAGIGNHLADDIVFAAGILPTVRTEKLKEEHWNRVFFAMLDVLHHAIEHENDMDLQISSKLHEKSYAGEAMDISIHGKTGEPCPKCGTPIEVTLIQRRPSNFCPKCQIDPTADGHENE
ncbi:formamidopyrimidine-DNA glycosylase [Paenibacillus alvei]|uniref:DNA-formamidopyrimidine glycosylase family protein n=1 Tax=Paenibacillus alvei TaxID=44250 RepID=UPI00028911DC|nr:DNA-formamidopyrimidine glycosylase family protein [Paenibacillus alvei]EJW15689.1 DNA lyase [Paenibacillus alvei DSM 29]MCY9543792.1 formamidopyrimidine-DNA glycosylase [Paenibacillus alvei]MCY9707489.1 formamidopyrimidine-DNA glycosylase [Paenibacillus alvei]MCY9734109.1 formamidopyrimidine-DNA glycosylase [Paenibacillus alvei]MCY9756286.1 formamidopyrimidine-DNA glycosylase [Paenibacillus alvei]